MNKDLTFSKTITIKAPVEKVWEALTKAEHVKKFLFGTNLDTTWEIGTPVKFQGEWEGKPYEDKGIVEHYEENKSLSYSYWSNFSGKEDNPENYYSIGYDVKSIDPQTTELTISQQGAEDQAGIDHSAKNWESVMENIKQMLEA